MKQIFLLGCIFLLFCSSANAALETIGTATYLGSEYNLIWDNDNNGNSVVWLDYSHSTETWSNQKSWASGLGASLTYNIDSAYSVAWNDAAWRLPTTVDGTYEFGYDGTTTAGYNITSSEMGHLFYTELGNKGYFATDENTQSGWGLINTGGFNQLVAGQAGKYWSGTEYADNLGSAWFFKTYNGLQRTNSKSYSRYGLAVRSGQVSTAPVPEPATMLLFGLGLLGLAGISRKKHGN